MDSLAKFTSALPVLRRQPLATAAAAAAFYLLLVRALRFRRRDKIIRDYGYPKRTLASMTVDEAYDIHKQLANLEFPETVKTSLFFALFKTYAISSISKLLLATGQLSSPNTASKRTADTSVLMTETTQAARSSSRLFDSIARINYLHSRYRRAGKISDDDMLYTLSLFALEPSRWATRMDWREFSDVELSAEGVLWRDIGEALEIPYEKLEGYRDGDDGLVWLRALEAWSWRYESVKAVPDEGNRTVAVGTLDILLTNVPLFAKGFFAGVVSAVLDERTRAGMMLQEPTWAHRTFASTLLAARRLFVGYLSLPRPSWLAVKRIDEERDPTTGKYHTHVYFGHPWYVKPTLAERWGPSAIATRILGGLVPGQSNRYRPEGYEIAELGPEGLKDKGGEEMEGTRAWMKERRRMGGCPMAL